MDKKNEDKVGYKKPPKASQFKKGQSGNIKGRPKGSKSFAPLSNNIHELRKLLVDVAHEEITIKVNGKEERVQRITAMFQQLFNAGISGNTAASIKTINLLTDAMVNLESTSKRVLQVTRETRSAERDFIFSPLPKPGTVGEKMYRKYTDFSENFACREIYGEENFPPINADEPLTEEDWIAFKDDMRETYLKIGNRLPEDFY